MSGATATLNKSKERQIKEIWRRDTKEQDRDAGAGAADLRVSHRNLCPMSLFP